MKKEKTWLLRGTICYCHSEKDYCSVVIRLNSFQSGNAKAYRYQKQKPRLRLTYLDNAFEILKDFEPYRGEDVIIWVLEKQQGEKKMYSLKKIREDIYQGNDGEIQDVSEFLENCI